MKIVRQLVALLTSVTMLHLSVVAGDAACATHGTDGHPMTGTHDARTGGHSMPMQGHLMTAQPITTGALAATGQASQPDTAPCAIPAQQDCCRAQLGCRAASAVASTRQQLASTPACSTRIDEALGDAPASFASAPEPPPPKA
jgi:hypothetical protein